MLTGASASCTNKPKVVALQDLYTDADGIHNFVAFCPRFFTEYRTHHHFDPLPGIPAPDPAKMGSNIDAMLDDEFTINNESGASVLLHGELGNVLVTSLIVFRGSTLD